MSRYIIWNKKDEIKTPVGSIYTAEEWIAKRPVAGVTKTVCGGGELNGAYFGVFSDMVDRARRGGCDFSECTTDQDYLDAIEAFEDERNKPSTEPTAEERIAAAMEYQNALAE